jgi:cobalt-zinc-cadmium efflux system outer membrane protein
MPIVSLPRAIVAGLLAIAVPGVSFAQPLIPTAQELYGPPVYGSVTRALARGDDGARPSAGRALTLTAAVRRALTANPRLTAAEREVGIAAGKRTQSGAWSNPELSFELDNALGSGPYRGFRSAETTLQLSQLIELGGKREARLAAGQAEVDSTKWQRLALRLEIASDAATAFLAILGGQRKVQIYDAQVRALDRLLPRLRERVDAGASSPAEIGRAQIAADLVRAERERARTATAVARRELAALMGADAPDFGEAVGDLASVGAPPPYPAVVRGLEQHPQLARWLATRAQRDAEVLSARLKAVPDVKVSAAWRHYRDTDDNAVRVGASVALPVWDQNLGGITEAREARGKADAEYAAARATLLLTLARAYETLQGALRELEPLRRSALPQVRQTVEAIESGYAQGRFTLLDVLDVQNTTTQAALREQEVLLNFHTALATLEALTGAPVPLALARAR